MVAVTILVVAIVLSMQPMMAAMVRIADARTLTVAENLAQAEIESIRSLSYQDVGNPGYTPSGVIPRSREVEVEGIEYRIETVVTYEGSITGLNVIEQGGDGVQGTWDPGVDYKYARVTVTPLNGITGPVIMETLVAPGNLAAHEGIASIRVTLARYEPFEPSSLRFPSLAIQSPPALPIRSGAFTEKQVFPAIPEGDYTVSLDQSNGWVIHPADTVAGLQQVSATAGLLRETTLRVYRPARLLATITDADSGEAVPQARISLTHIPTRAQTDYGPGVHTIEGLIPDAYDITVSAADYHPYSAGSVNIPDGYPGSDHLLSVALVPVPPPSTTTTTTTSTTTTIPNETTTTTEPPSTTTTTTVPPGTVAVTITVKDNTNRVVNGATVAIPHPTRGTLTAVTDEYGRAYFDLEEGTRFTATAATDWGHGPASVTWDPRQHRTREIKLTRPSGRGTMVLRGAHRAVFLVDRGSGWGILLPNHQGEASFIATQGWYLAAKRCDDNGSIQNAGWVYVRVNRNNAATLPGWCPS